MHQIFGLYSTQERVELYFRELLLFSYIVNKPSVCSKYYSALSGTDLTLLAIAAIKIKQLRIFVMSCFSSHLDF